MNRKTTHLKKEASDKIVDKAEKSRNLPYGLSLYKSMIKDRIIWGRILVAHCGHTSHLIGIKPAIISTIK